MTEIIETEHQDTLSEDDARQNYGDAPVPHEDAEEPDSDLPEVAPDESDPPDDDFQEEDESE